MRLPVVAVAFTVAVTLVVWFASGMPAHDNKMEAMETAICRPDALILQAVRNEASDDGGNRSAAGNDSAPFSCDSAARLR